MPSPPAGSWNNETNPPSAGVLSRCGVCASDQVAPPSEEVLTCTPYVESCLLISPIQWAARVPSASRTTEGTSAQLTNRSTPSTIVRGSDQPLSDFAANRSRCVPP